MTEHELTKTSGFLLQDRSNPLPFSNLESLNSGSCTRFPRASFQYLTSSVIVILTPRADFNQLI